MKVLCLFLSLLLSHSAVLACEIPSPKYVQNFFSGEPEWKEVRSKTDYKIAKRKPIRMIINFKSPLDSLVKMGKKRLDKEGTRFCKGTSKNKLEIKKKVPIFGTVTMTFTRHDRDYITSVDPANGTLHYRRASKVIDNEKTSSIPSEEPHKNRSTSSI